MSGHGDDWNSWDWDVHQLLGNAYYDFANDQASTWSAATGKCSWSPKGNMMTYDLHRVEGSGIEYIKVVRLRYKDRALTVVREDTLFYSGRDACFAPDGKSI